MKKRVLAISGSTRKNSANYFILRTISDLYQESLDVDIYDGMDKLPHFNPDLDNENLPDEVRDLRERISRSQGVIICTPEYVFSIPGSLKNAIEWNVSTTLFSQKPVAIIVASASGVKAFESLTLIMTTIEAKISEKSKLLIQGAKGVVGSDGLITNQAILDKIRELVDSFLIAMKE